MPEKNKCTLITKRFSVLTNDEMNDHQREMVKDFKGFSLNGMRGPFNLMLRSPKAAEQFQALGKYLRFKTGIDNRLVELLVLIHARIWSDQYEWELHAPRAATAGVSEEIIEDICQGRIPSNLSADENAIFCYVLELEIKRKVTEPTFRNAIDELGEQAITDIVFMIGQYTTISMALAVLEEVADKNRLPPCDKPFADYFNVNNQN